MTRNRLKGWQFIHRWSSLVSTALLLMLCLTGLPLIFLPEIERSMQPALAAPLADPPALESLIDKARAVGRGAAVHQLGFQPDRRLVQIDVGAAGDFDGLSVEPVLLDMANGNVVAETEGSPLLAIILRLHVDMFAGLPGSLILGAMGVLLLVAIASGVALYGPFTQKLPFGTVRRGRRARWLDLHNLLGIVTVAWLSVVGLTGALNTLSSIVIQHWQKTDLPAMAAPFMEGQPVARPIPARTAIRAAERRLPGMWVAGVYYPGSTFATPRHFGVYLRGATPLTARLLTPVLVDAETGQIAAVGRMPAYVNLLLISQPLHFGDYGGLPLKLLWAVFDLATIAVLISGLWLFVRRKAQRTRKVRDEGTLGRTDHRAATRLSLSQQWVKPVAIGLSCLAGLLLALVSPPGPWRWLAWVLIAWPALDAALYIYRHR